MISKSSGKARKILRHDNENTLHSHDTPKCLKSSCHSWLLIVNSCTRTIKIQKHTSLWRSKPRHIIPSSTQTVSHYNSWSTVAEPQLRRRPDVQNSLLSSETDARSEGRQHWKYPLETGNVKVVLCVFQNFKLCQCVN